MRRLTEIGVLRRDSGTVMVASAWSADTGFGSGADDLASMLRARGAL
jgi:pilus assembly protein CpaF